MVGSNWALADRSEVMEKLQMGEIPEQAPVHFTNEEPGEGEASRVTTVPAGSATLHPAVDPEEQLTPFPDTVPFPDPTVPTLSAKEFGGTVPKVAETAVFARIVMLQEGEVPEQAPPHPVKTEPGPAVAESVTGAPATRLLLQPDVDPDVQLNPPPEIVPVPVPLVDAESR